MDGGPYVLMDILRKESRNGWNVTRNFDLEATFDRCILDIRE